MKSWRATQAGLQKVMNIPWCAAILKNCHSEWSEIKIIFHPDKNPTNTGAERTHVCQMQSLIPDKAWQFPPTLKAYKQRYRNICQPTHRLNNITHRSSQCSITPIISKEDWTVALIHLLHEKFSPLPNFSFWFPILMQFLSIIKKIKTEKNRKCQNKLKWLQHLLLSWSKKKQDCVLQNRIAQCFSYHSLDAFSPE